MSGLTVGVARYRSYRRGWYPWSVEELDRIGCPASDQLVISVAIVFLQASGVGQDSAKHIVGGLVLVIGDAQHEPSVVHCPGPRDGCAHFGLAGFFRTGVDRCAVGE